MPQTKKPAAARRKAAKPPAHRAAVIYIRVSTPRQAKEGDSPQAQLAAATKFARSRGLRLIGQFTDGGRSGRTRKGRTALEEAIAKARAAQGVLIVRQLSRLGRSVIDLHTIAHSLERSGADLASVNESLDTSTAAGKAFFGFLAVMAAFESDLIAERAREAYAFRKSIGQPILAGVPRFGWRVARGKLVPHDEAAKIVRLVKQLRRGRSYKQVARELNRRKIKTPDQLLGRKRPGLRKARWHASSVWRIVHRPTPEVDPQPPRRRK